MVRNNQLIIDIVSQHPEGLTIGEIALALKWSRTTTSRHLNLLIGQGIILQRVIGNAKLHYHNIIDLKETDNGNNTL